MIILRIIIVLLYFLTSADVFSQFRFSREGTTDSLIAWWKFSFENETGGNFTDLSGNGHTAVCSDASPDFANDRFGRSLSAFNLDESEKIDVASLDNTDFPQYQCTVTLFAYCVNWSQLATGDYYLLGLYSADAFNFFLRTSSGNNQLFFRSGTSIAYDNSSLNQGVNAGWNFYCVTFDTLTNVIQYYVNGHLSATGELGLDWSPAEQTDDFGRDTRGLFEAYHDEMRVYNRVLSAIEISELYHSSAQRIKQDYFR